MNVDELAAHLAATAGGVGAAYNVQPQQPGVGAALNVTRMQPGHAGGMYGPGVGVPASPGMVQAGKVNYDQASYDAGGLSWLGFGQTSIAAGVTNQVVPITTQRPFTPQLVYHPSTVFGLLINQVQLEGTNLFANTLGIPIELWSEVSNAPQIQWPTLDTATGINFVVSNPTGGALNFSGGFWGTQIRR